MKTIPHRSILMGMMIPVVAVAQEKGNHQRLNGPRGREETSLNQGPTFDTWRDADMDGDKLVSRSEFDQMSRVSLLPEEKRTQLFERLDKNHDGQISRKELLEISKSKSEALRARLWELDTDKDGGVSFEEFRAGPIYNKLPIEKQRLVFQRLDTDGDGKITLKDRPRHPEGDEDEFQLPWPKQLLLGADQNHDGAVTFEEFRAAPRSKEFTDEQLKRRFRELDKNHDGKIDRKDQPNPVSLEPVEDFKRSAPEVPAE